MTEADPIKTYDARWEAHEFDDVAVTRLFEATCAYGRELGVDTLALARDARLAAPHVLELACEVAVRAGFHVYLSPRAISTPQAYFLAMQVTSRHPGTMGLMITASHNPRDYIGVKFTVPSVAAIGMDCGPAGGLRRIRELYHAKPRANSGGMGPGSVTLIDPGAEYLRFSMEEAGVGPGELAGLKVVLDGFHGSAGPELINALQLAGVEVEALRIIPDGSFPTGSPNPTSLGKMDAAVARAKEVGAHAVIGLDGDGDRLVFGDARGVLTAGFVAVPILRACVPAVAASRVPVLYDPKVSPAALAEWGRLAVRPVLFRNGHSQIKDYMRRIGAIAAAEESGHYYHRITMGPLTVCCENTILTSLLFLRSLHRRRELMDELWAGQEQACTTGEFNYQFDSDETRDRALATVIHRLRSEGAAIQTTTPDGIDLEGTVVSQGVSISEAGVSLADTWYSGYLRIATNEKAVVRCYFSAGDTTGLASVETLARDLLAGPFQGRVIE